MNNYINENYTVVWRHPESTDTDWNTFLLEEVHDDEEVKKINGAFVSLFSSPESVLIVEGEEKLLRSRSPKINVKNYFISTPTITDDRIFGWDMKDWFLLSQSRGYAYSIAVDILSSYEDAWKLLDFRTAMLKCWDEEFVKVADPELLAQEDLLRQAEEVIGAVAEEIQEFLDQKIAPLELNEKDCFARSGKLLELADIFMNAQDVCKDSSDEAVIRENLYNCRRASISLLKKSIDCRCQKEFLIAQKSGELIERQRDLLRKYFPIRTHDMVQTLENIHLFIFMGAANRFLIAGTHHLEEENKSQDNKDPFSLKELHNFLSTRKNIAILRPKILK